MLLVNVIKGSLLIERVFISYIRVGKKGFFRVGELKKKYVLFNVHKENPVFFALNVKQNVL